MVVSLVQASSVNQGEARALRLACVFLQALGLINVQVERDNKSVIELSTSELVPPWDCRACILDIHSLSLSSSISFPWVPREANSVVHGIATTHLKGALPLGWVGSPTTPLKELLLLDVSL
ncbi:hypothetical protein ACSBR1_019055 [Camellia fascicularis]